MSIASWLQRCSTQLAWYVLDTLRGGDKHRMRIRWLDFFLLFPAYTGEKVRVSQGSIFILQLEGRLPSASDLQYLLSLQNFTMVHKDCTVLFHSSAHIQNRLYCLLCMSHKITMILISSASVFFSMMLQSMTLFKLLQGANCSLDHLSYPERKEGKKIILY